MVLRWGVDVTSVEAGVQGVDVEGLVSLRMVVGVCVPLPACECGGVRARASG